MDYTNSSKKTLLTDFENNPLIKLVCFCGYGYILLHLVKIILFMWQQVPSPQTGHYFDTKIYTVFAIQPLSGMLQRPWTLLSFMFTNLSFFKIFTSMVWLMVFGNVVQQLVGKSEVLPMFITTNILGALAFIGLLEIFPTTSPYNMFSGADASILAFAIGTMAIAPKYRVYFSNHFQVPLWALTLIYIIITLVVSYNSTNYPYFGLLIAGAIGGIIYMIAAKSGFKFGVFSNKIYQWFALKLRSKRKIGDQEIIADNETINRILDKINDQGIQSLHPEERALIEKSKK